MLAGISGPEICIRLRAEEATRTVPIIMLSARGDESLRLRSFSAGADDFVVKPFSMPELIARVRALLRRWPTTFLFEASFNSITRLEGSAGARATFVSARRSSGCSNVCSSDLAASFHGSSFWSAPGSDPLTSRIEPSMST
jgi:DNA-binding response OmpR family regulator